MGSLALTVTVPNAENLKNLDFKNNVLHLQVHVKVGENQALSGNLYIPAGEQRDTIPGLIDLLLKQNGY